MNVTNIRINDKFTAIVNSLQISVDYQIFDNTVQQVEYYLDHISGIYLPNDMQQVSIKRQSEFLAGRVCALNAMKKYGLTKVTQPNSHIARFPSWPNGVVGSISHSKNIAIAAVSSKSVFAGIGIDIEEIILAKRAESLIYQIANDKELKLFNALNLSIAEIFVIIFSGKEALFKALYPQIGKKFYFNDIQCIDIMPNKNNWSMMLTKSLSTNHNAGTIYHGYFGIETKYITSLVALR